MFWYPRGRQAALVVAVLAVAAFNLSFRLGSESVSEWDESLYANSALDMLNGSGLVVTTIAGETDYFNAKPPLNVWLIAGSLHVFGRSLLAMRVTAVVAAWLTIALLLVWGWRRVSPGAGLFAALVLSTSFGFLHVHSGRSATPDALLALFLLLTVITLDVAAVRPWRRAWLGPLVAGVFFLKGMAALLPLLLIAIVEMRRRMPTRDRWIPLGLAASVAAAPIAWWAIARWRVDRELFFERCSSRTSLTSAYGGSPSNADHRGSI